MAERTISWLSKRRGLRTQWAKKAENWLSFSLPALTSCSTWQFSDRVGVLRSSPCPAREATQYRLVKNTAIERCAKHAFVVTWWTKQHQAQGRG
jgi:hypothetical protein